MNSMAETSQKSHRNEIIIAVIGLIGIVSTGILSNWDKLFAEGQVLEASYSGYKPTGIFETELRYYFDVSGARAAMEENQKQLVQAYKNQLLNEHPEDARTITEVMNAVLEEALSVDEVVKKFMPIYQKHFTLPEIQELNRFYSTDIMQQMVRKLPLLTQEAAPLQVEMMQELQKKLLTRLENIE